MNIPLNNRAIAGLRGLYQENEAAKALFDKFAERKKHSRETLATRAASLARCDYRDMVAILKQLAALGVGKFKAGRRGSVSRMVWSYHLRSIGAAAQGSESYLQDVPADAELSEDDDWSEAPELLFDEEDDFIEHTFQLRPDVRIAVRLPKDITSKEAERLAGFVRQLPFED